VPRDRRTSVVVASTTCTAILPTLPSTIQEASGTRLWPGIDAVERAQWRCSRRRGPLAGAQATWLNANGDQSALVYGGSLLGRISEHAKLLAEVVSAAGGSDFRAASTFLLNYGVRFHSHNFAGDIGLVRPIGEHVGDEFVLGFPFINFSYRSP
jgi:hypothetical protein